MDIFRDLDRQQHKHHITIDEKHVKLEDLTGPIPAYYFPIASHENLIEKVNELYRVKAGQRASLPSPPFPAGGLPSMPPFPPGGSAGIPPFPPQPRRFPPPHPTR